MPRKKGLGKGVENSLDEMDQLIKDLEKFGTKTCRKTLKKVVSSIAMEKEDREPLLKMINDASELSLSLSNKVDDIRDKIKIIKPKGNSRFAREVVNRFLEGRP